MELEVIQTLKSILGQAQCPDTQAAQRVLNAHVALDNEYRAWQEQRAEELQKPPTPEQFAAANRQEEII